MIKMCKEAILIVKIILTFTFFSFTSNSFANTEELYAKLVQDWPSIFPDGNRNAAGPRFFKYILDQDLKYEEFLQFNKLYCAVSGSLISPDVQPDEIFLTNSDNDEKICGQYYKCCWPCLCDVMKYSETKKIKIDFKDQSKDIYTIVIDNPCNKNDFPERVNRDYFCNGNELNNAKKCDAYDIDYVQNNQITGPMCEARNSMPLGELNSGMGDIFIRLAN